MSPFSQAAPRSGCWGPTLGKSTAIRLGLGLITPSAGEIRVFGERMTPGAGAWAAARFSSFDEPVFPKDQSAIGYLRFVGRCFGLENRKGRRNGHAAAGGWPDGRRGAQDRHLSTGMKTRLGIAASLMDDPELLVWDEPTAGRPHGRRQTLELLDSCRPQDGVPEFAYPGGH